MGSELDTNIIAANEVSHEPASHVMAHAISHASRPHLGVHNDSLKGARTTPQTDAAELVAPNQSGFDISTFGSKASNPYQDFSFHTRDQSEHNSILEDAENPSVSSSMLAAFIFDMRATNVGWQEEHAPMRREDIAAPINADAGG